MNKRIRQYIGLFSAIIAYYIIHEGAHFLYSLSIGAFKQIHFLGLGIQIDVYVDKMTQEQLGIFCLLGSVATAITAYILIGCIPRIAKSNSKIFKACMYYITLALLLLDPLYLSVLYSFFGGGDMNGIALLIPEITARIIYSVLFLIHLAILFKVVIPRYTKTFHNNEADT